MPRSVNAKGPAVTSPVSRESRGRFCFIPRRIAARRHPATHQGWRGSASPSSRRARHRGALSGVMFYRGLNFRPCCSPRPLVSGGLAGAGLIYARAGLTADDPEDLSVDRALTSRTSTRPPRWARMSLIRMAAHLPRPPRSPAMQQGASAGPGLLSLANVSS